MAATTFGNSFTGIQSSTGVSGSGLVSGTGLFYGKIAILRILLKFGK
jgi:hypothetical protein